MGSQAEEAFFLIRRVPVRIPSSKPHVPAERILTIVMQSHNGPCPLLAIFNAFLLLRRFALPDDLNVISASEMCRMIRDYAYSNAHELGGSGSAAAASDAASVTFVVSEAMAFLPSLVTGLDLNLSFAHCEAFEYTPALSVFDCVALRIFHCWVTSEPELRDLTFNACMDRLAGDAPASGVDLLREWMDTSGQSTAEGVSQLTDRMRELEVGILFRCNHFVTVFKFGATLFCLASDEAWSDVNVVWEQLAPGAGQGRLLDGYFNSVTAATPRVEPVPTSTPTAAAAAAASARAAAAPRPAPAPVAQGSDVPAAAAVQVGRNDRYGVAASTLRSATMGRYRSELLARGFDRAAIDGMSDDDVYAAVKSMGLPSPPPAAATGAGWRWPAQPGPRPTPVPAGGGGDGSGCVVQ